MSLKRIFGITIFGAAVIVCVFIVMLTVSYLTRENIEIPLPESLPSGPEEASPGGPGIDIEKVEFTKDTVQDVIRTLSRPVKYTRDLTVESFWESGSAVYTITTAVSADVVSLRILSGGTEKRVIITKDTLYIWYQGDSATYTGRLDSPDDWLRVSDERQMMLTYEDVLNLKKSDILDAGFTQYGGESCIYVVFKSSSFGYITRCYVSVELGLITGAEEYDGETPVSKMTAGVCVIGEPDESAFTLPDGTSIL